MRMNAFAWPLALGSLLALSACNSTGAPAQAPAAAAAPPDGATQLDSGQPPRNQCNAQAVQSLVGQPYHGAGTLAQALAAAGADTVRMLRPDSMITKEYRVGRLNVVVDHATGSSSA